VNPPKKNKFPAGFRKLCCSYFRYIKRYEVYHLKLSLFPETFFPVSEMLSHFREASVIEAEVTIAAATNGSNDFQMTFKEQFFAIKLI